MTRLLRRFGKDTSGNVALIFAIASVPLFAAAGLALDYAYAARERTDLQNAIDAAAISLAKMPKGTSNDVLKQKAEDFVAAMMPNPKAQNIGIQVSTARGELEITATADYPTVIVRVLDLITGDHSHDTMRIGTSSTAKWGGGRVEVALALDNTTSMDSSNKMKELKKAVKAMIDDIEAAVVEDDDARIAIVPFNTVVKIGTGYKDESWLAYKPDKNAPKDDDRVKKKDWKGCVLDRDQPNDTNDAAPTSDATKFPAGACEGNLVTVTTLSTDWDDLRDKVDDMQPAGTTNVTIGLEWAWHVLSKKAPITDGSDPTVKTDNPITKYIVLLTDGDNTKNRWSSSTKTIDARTKLACANAKADGIKIFAVRVIDGNEALLKDCASDSKTMYYDVDNAAQIGAVFDNITSTIVKLHLAH